MSKWGAAFWQDWLERVVSVAVYTLIPTIPVLAQTDISWQWAWATVGAPTALAALTGLAANLKNATTGASLLNTAQPTAPQPAPEHLAEG